MILPIVHLGLWHLLFISTQTGSVLGDIKLSQGEQVALESTQALLPPETLSRKIGLEIARLQASSPNISDIQHQPIWAPGELLAQTISDQQIAALRQTGPKYALLTVNRNSWGSHLYFGKPFNPVNLGKVLFAEFGFQSSPNDNEWRTQKILYNVFRKEYSFERGEGICLRDSWPGWPCVETAYWIFTESSDGKFINLTSQGVRQSKDNPPPSNSDDEGQGGAVGVGQGGPANEELDVPQPQIKPRFYAPTTRHHSIQFGL